MSKKRKKENGLCTYSHCRTPSEVIVAYIGEEYCDKHHELHCETYDFPKAKYEDVIK